MRHGTADAQLAGIDAGLDAVDRAAPEAYGSAEEVPGLLRAVGSADPAARDVAYDEPGSALRRQGTTPGPRQGFRPFRSSSDDRRT
ncbi:hypothetical protein [Streptomyces sp. NPDC048623]|uniref:hypothetical protein n=1 Tax=Streptomyces sp. NPDC048623 TaxID=3155761 RepID=UPI00341C621E